MSTGPRLTSTSYIVLGLLSSVGKATPYELKAIVTGGLGEFWSLPHAQLYNEPERLASAGYLSEEREEGGRRRKHYEITAAGRRALREWLARPTEELTELRDPGLLKLFFGADPKPLAEAQLGAHRVKLAEHERTLKEIDARTPQGVRLSLEAGIGHEREWVRFWSRLAVSGPGEEA